MSTAIRTGDAFSTLRSRSWFSAIKHRWGRTVWIGMPALALFATIQIPIPAGGSLDDSWQCILAYGFLHKLVYGRDLVFTFGPLGALENVVQLPELFWLQVIWQVATRLAVAVLMAIWMRGAPRWTQALTFGAMLFMSASSQGPSGVPTNDAFCMLAIWVAAAALITDRARSVKTTLLSLAVLAAFSLTKCSLLVAAVAAVVTVGIFHCRQRRFARGAILVSGFGTAWLAGWCLSGQPLGSIVDFAGGAAEIMKGYTEAMGSFPRLKHLAAAGVVATLFLILVWFQSLKLQPKPHGVALALLTSGLLFLTWRHGTCRTDVFHLSSLFTWVALVALLLISGPRQDHRADLKQSVLPGIAVAAAAILLFAGLFPETHFLRAKILDGARNVQRECLLALHPAAVVQDWRDADERNRRALELPAIRATVGDSELDVHGHLQAEAILGRYHYVPRPVPQSYAAYTPRLAAQNAAWVAIKRPAFILMKVESIDQRLPALDDAPALAWALQNCRVSVEEKGFLLLSPGPRSAPGFLRPFPENAELQLNEWWPVPPALEGQLCYLRIDAAMTAAGGLVQNFLPVRPLGLEIKFAGGQTEVYHLPLLMARTGFLIQPFIRSNADVVQWMDRQASERIAALRIVAPSPNWFYRKIAVVTFTRSGP